jgi:hypothetical protein
VQLLGPARYAAKVALEAHLAPPPQGTRAQRFFWGLALPFGVVRATFKDHAARAHWLRWSGVQLAILLAVGVRIGLAKSELVERGHHPSFLDLVEFLTASYAALTILEWILIALARDYHDVLSQLAARTTGVVAEPIVGPPRIRLDFPWLWTKLKRRIRAVWLFAVALPLFGLTLGIPFAGEWVYLALSTAWAAYWLAVFAVGGSFLAWEPVPATPPWFARALTRIGKVPVVGIPPRLYGRFLAWATRGVAPVCLAFERDPWAASGLATARLLAGIPGVYLFLRPAFGVAATHTILVARGPSLPPVPFLVGPSPTAPPPSPPHIPPPPPGPPSN